MSRPVLVLILTLAFGLAAGWLGLGFAQEPRENGLPAPIELRLSLREAIELALQENIQVRLLRERIEAASAAAFTQLGALLPTLSGTVSQNSQNFFLGTIGGAPVATDTFQIFDSRTSLTQNLFSLSLIQRWRAARTGVEVAHLEAETGRRDTAATVALLYYEALRARALVEASQENVRMNLELYTLAKDRQAGGMATALDTARAEAQLENEKQRLLFLTSEWKRTQLNLLRALGIRLDVQLTLTDHFHLFDDHPVTVERALASAFENRPELKAQSQRVKLATLTLRSVTSERVPSLMARGDVGLIGNRADATLQTHNVGVVLSVPIFDGGQREGRIKESRSQLNQELIRMKDVTDQVTLEVRQAAATLDLAQDQVLVSERGLASALREMDLAQERFVMLAASNIELTNAQTSLARARENRIEALFRFNAARVNLARAQGRLEDLY